jgi:hypothetical protein
MVETRTKIVVGEVQREIPDASIHSAEDDVVGGEMHKMLQLGHQRSTAIAIQGVPRGRGEPTAYTGKSLKAGLHMSCTSVTSVPLWASENIPCV